MTKTATSFPLGFAAALVACILPSSASAASWVFVADCGDGPAVRPYSYDADSIRRKDGNVQVWVKGDYSRIRGSQAQEAKMLWSFDCPGQAVVEISRSEYGASGKIIKSYGKRTAPMAIPRESIAAKVHSVVCA